MSLGGGRYRPDIDGLRAVAVLAVVGYHYGPSYVPGGFVGVDVFFAISGYLITGLLATAFETQTLGYSLLDFYRRRLRRIFPAVSLVLGFCLVVGWLFLFPLEYRSLGKHVAASAGFIQNFTLWLEAGYFDTGAIQKPLLHFWSLAVEEQFYIFWPLALWIIMRRRWPVMASILAIAALSFAWNLWLVWNGHSSAAFYLPITRAWELMVGAWLAIAHHHALPWLSKWASAQSWLGAILIALGIVLIRPEYGFPGFWALFPVVGTALLINAGPTTFLNGRLLSLRPAVWIGLISYPLYLWHWVLLSLTFTIFGLTGDFTGHVVKVILIALSFVLAWLTYRGLEKPLRRRKGRVATSLAIFVALLGLLGLGVYFTNGMQLRPLTVVQLENASRFKSASRSPLSDQCMDLNEGSSFPGPWSCVLGNEQAKTWIAVMGDSHAGSMIPALNKYGHKANIKIVFAAQSGCLLLLDVFMGRDSGHACYKLARKMADKAKSNSPAAIVFIQRWTYYSQTGDTRPDEVQDIHVVSQEDTSNPAVGMAALRHGLITTLSYYQSLNVPVVLLEDNPQQDKTISGLRAQLRFMEHMTPGDWNETAISLAQHHRDQRDVNRLLEDFAAKSPMTSTLNINSALCGYEICPWVMNGKFLYYNDDHLSITGAMQVYPLLTEHLNKVLERSD